MKLGVLECGPVAKSLVEKHGPYTDFFRRMLQGVNPETEMKGWRSYLGELPISPNEMDGWLISGSKFGAYEDHDWIPPLEEFLRDALRLRVPMAGFCFGHQILAQAAGGTVVKSDKGWGLGVHEYVTNTETQSSPDLPKFSAIAIHQDQVVEKPANTTVIASSDFCEFAGLAYGDPDDPFAITVQPHPEFDMRFTKELISERSGTVFPKDVSDVALASLETDVHNSELANWIYEFFVRALDGRRREI